MSQSMLGRTLAACAVVFATAAPDDAVLSRIERYCTVSWQNAGIAPQDWGDCTQEAFLELLERIAKERWRMAVEEPTSEERRELNRSIWCIVKRWQRAPRPERLETDAADGRTAPAQLAADEWADMTRQARLSREQQRILELWSHGTPVAEIATTLNLPAARISDQKFKAIQKLRTIAHV